MPNRDPRLLPGLFSQLRTNPSFDQNVPLWQSFNNTPYQQPGFLRRLFGDQGAQRNANFQDLALQAKAQHDELLAQQEKALALQNNAFRGNKEQTGFEGEQNERLATLHGLLSQRAGEAQRIGNLEQIREQGRVNRDTGLALSDAEGLNAMLLRGTPQALDPSVSAQNNAQAALLNREASGARSLGGGLIERPDQSLMQVTMQSPEMAQMYSMNHGGAMPPDRQVYVGPEAARAAQEYKAKQLSDSRTPGLLGSFGGQQEEAGGAFTPVTRTAPLFTGMGNTPMSAGDALKQTSAEIDTGDGTKSDKEASRGRATIQVTPPGQEKTRTNIEVKGPSPVSLEPGSTNSVFRPLVNPTQPFALPNDVFGYRGAPGAYYGKRIVNALSAGQGMSPEDIQEYLIRAQGGF